MLIGGGLLGSNPEDASARLVAGQTFYLQGQQSHGIPGSGSASALAAASATTVANNTQARLRWRASKGSAPTNRFRRSIGDNTEGWHRTMPVGIETVVTVDVPAVFLRELAVHPTVSPGTATVAASTTTIKLVALAPAVSQTTQVAVPASRVTLAGVAPAVTSTVTRAVPVVDVRFVAVPAGVTPGVSTRPVPSSAVRLVAVSPMIVGFIPVQAARLTLVAIEPAVSGGGGPLVVVLPRSSGEGVGSVAVLPPA